MTNEQVERAQRILDEQYTLTKDYGKTQYGRKNGEDFPDLVRAALASKGFCEVLGTGAMLSMLMLTVVGPKSLTEHLQDKENGMVKIASDPMLNGTALDVFWLGYQVGRQMEREEAKVLAEIERSSQGGK